MGWQEIRRIDQFYVPSGFIKVFAQYMQKYQLENILVGVEDDDLIIFVSYEVSKQKSVDAIHRAIERYIADQENQKWKLNGHL